MTKWKALAVCFTLVFFGGVRETLRIIFSPADDIKNNRAELIILAVVIDLVMLFYAVRFWRRTFKEDNNRLN